MSRSCHSATSSSAALRVAAQQAREPAQVLRQDRVLLVRHRRRALLPLAERLLASPTSVRCQWRTVERHLLDRGAERAPARRSRPAWRSRATIWVATVSAPQAQLRQRPRLDRRVEVGVGADGAGDLADRDRLARRDQRAARAPDLGVEAGEDQAGGDRLGVDAVRAADHRRARVLLGAAAAGGAQLGRGPPRIWSRRLDELDARARRRARRTTSCRGAASAPARRPAPRRGSGRRSRRGACAPRARGCARRSSLPAALARTASASRAGTLPAASIASQAASSTRSQMS